MALMVFCCFHSEVSIFMMDLDSKLEVLFVPLKQKRGRDVWQGEVESISTPEHPL